MEKYIADRIVTINVDVQNDFCPGGALAVTDGDQVIPPLNELNTFTRLNDGLVIATGDQHPVKTPHFNTWPVHCVAGTEGAQLHDGLDIQPADIIINKGMYQTDGYSAFEGITTNGDTLESFVRPVGRERVAALVGGLATDYCILNTVLDGLKINPGDGELRLFVARDAVRAVNIQANDGDEALARMEEAGATIVDTVDILTQAAFEIARKGQS